MVMAGVPVAQQQCWLTFDHLKYPEAPNGSERFNLFHCSQLNLKPKRRKVFSKGTVHWTGLKCQSQKE